MKKKKYLVIFIIAFLIVTLSIGFCTKVFAVDLGLEDLEAYGKQPTSAQSDSFKQKAESILGIISTAGIVLSVVILIMIGIKYMLGSVEERAEYKKELKPYLIGCFILFTGSLVPQIIFNIMQGI